MHFVKACKGFFCLTSKAILYVALFSAMYFLVLLLWENIHSFSHFLPLSNRDDNILCT